MDLVIRRALTWPKSSSHSLGSEANEAAQKLTYQYHSQLKNNPQPQRRWFIARDRSYHGATLGALETSGHKGRKEMYTPILPEKTQFISPCNPCRDMTKGETTAQYVQRLGEELERKILELGPETVAGFVMEPVVGAVSSILITGPWLGAFCF
jgi:adenosylmethionine-8-amino-7-oxononanoate aminotransferase